MCNYFCRATRFDVYFLNSTVKRGSVQPDEKLIQPTSSPGRNHANEEETSALLFDAGYHINIDSLYFYVPFLFLNYRESIAR